MEGMVWGGAWVGGWVGGGDNDVRYNYWTHCVRRWSSPFHHAFIVPLLTSHALHHSSPHIRMEGMVWGGGGWVGGGGIMTFGTTTGHIVSVDDHHHFITHSSCHYSPLTHFIIRLRTYAWRVWYSRRRNCIGFRNIKVVIIVFIIIIIIIRIISWPVPCLKKDLPAAFAGWSIELWFLIPEHIFHWWWTMIETTKNTTAATADVTLLMGNSSFFHCEEWSCNPVLQLSM